MDHSCQPPSGKTYLTIGQDFFSIQEYLLSQYNASLEQESTLPLKKFAPAATMFYTDIQELKGLDTPVDYGSGIEYAGALAEAFPKSGIQIGLWLNGTQGCRDINRGKLNSQLHHLFASLDELDVPKVFLRVGYEFDNPWFGYSEHPRVYKTAFRTIVNFCERQLQHGKCREKIAFCWHSWAAPTRAQLDDFYPGSRYVDWIGISIFQQLYPWAKNSVTTSGNDFAGGTRDQVQKVLDFALKQNKPVMIAESTPFGGMSGMFLEDPSQDATNSSAIVWNEDDIWDLWFQPTLDLIEEYDIGMWSYINCDWDSQPMWHGVGFGDTRLSSSNDVMRRWREEVWKQDSRFLTSLDCHHATSGSTRIAHIKTTAKVMFAFDSVVAFIPMMCIVLFLCVLVWLVRRLFCKLRVDSAASLSSQHERQGYGSISQTHDRDALQGSSWSLNL